MDCPAPIDLFQEPRRDEIEAHVRGCPRCQVLLATGSGPDIALSSPKVGGEAPRGSNLETADEPRPGAIVTAAVEGSDQWMTAAIVDAEADQLTVAPISDQVVMATNWDLLLEQALLGYEAMAEVWNSGEILAEQVIGIRGALPDPLTEWLLALGQLAREGETPPEEAPVGVAVVGDADPRLAFQEEQASALERFWAPSLLLTGVASLGELVAARAGELEVDEAEIETAIDLDLWRELASDRLDVEGRAPVAAMAALMRTLQVPLVARVRTMVHDAVAANCQGDYETGLVLARQRRGTRQQQARPPAAECKRRADEYVEKLAAALGNE